MLFLIDSSAKDYLGHNLEYIERMSKYLAEPYVLLCNKKVANGDNRQGIFTFGTWDFNRLGLQINPGKKQEVRRPSAHPAVVEHRFYRNIDRYRMLERVIYLVLSKSKQARIFKGDLEKAGISIKKNDKIVVSTANSREIVGLFRFLTMQKRITGAAPICFIILRRPLTEIVGKATIVNYIEALMNRAAIKLTRSAITFAVDTNQLSQHYKDNLDLDFPSIGVLGFKPSGAIAKSQVYFLPPNARPETRNSSEDLSPLDRDSYDNYIKGLDSDLYFKTVSQSRYVILPYESNRYRYRSSGIFAEAVSVNSIPVVPTGSWMSQELASGFNTDISETKVRISGKRTNRDLPDSKEYIYFLMKAAGVPTNLCVRIKGETSFHSLTAGATSDLIIFPPHASGSLHIEILEENREITLFIGESKSIENGIPFFPKQLHSHLETLINRPFSKSQREGINPYDPRLVTQNIESLLV